MIDEVDLTAMAWVVNFEKPRDESNLQLVVYINPDYAPVSIEAPEESDVPDTEGLEEMRNFFGDYVER